MNKIKLYELEKLLDAMRDEGADNLTEVKFRSWCSYEYNVAAVSVIQNEDGENVIMLDN